MTNLEPTCELLRRRDVLAWLPTLSDEVLDAWVANKVVKVYQPYPGARRLFYKSSLVKIVNGGH